jgi:hypothetical protein
MARKSYSVTGIPDEVMSLLRDARERFEREHGVVVSFQAYLNKILKSAADAEAAKQAAGEEYEKQQREGAE